MKKNTKTKIKIIELISSFRTIILKDKTSIFYYLIICFKNNRKNKINCKNRINKINDAEDKENSLKINKTTNKTKVERNKSFNKRLCFELIKIKFNICNN